MPERPIYWHQGLFLQPQHLQLRDRWVRAELQPLRENVQPHLWGVSRLEFDAGAVETGRLQITRGEFLFRDGSLAAFPENAAIGPRKLDDVAVTGDSPVMVYVTLRGWDPRGGNATVIDDEEGAAAAKTMFSAASDPEDVPDLLGDGPAAQVQFMRYTLALRFEHELEGADQDGRRRIPVARLIKRSEKVVLDPDYAPPSLHMGAAAQPARILNNITDLLVTRCRQLEGYKSPEQTDSTGPDMSYLVLLMALRTLSRYAARCTHLNETPNVHPWRVYGVLRQLVAELSVFSLDVDILGFDGEGNQLLPAYDHTDLQSCFAAANDLILRIIDTIGAGPELLLTMRHEPPFHRVDLPERVLEAGKRFWLILNTEADAEWVFESAGRLLKLSPSSGMTTILAKAVSGIPVSPHAGPPAGLPRRPNAHYFRIGTDSPLWDDVRKSGALTLFWDEAPEDLTAQIAVLGMGR